LSRPAIAQGALLLALAASASYPAFNDPGLRAYRPFFRGDGDSVRSRSAATHSSKLVATTVVPGYWSSWGLPPVAGRFTVGMTTMDFRPIDGGSVDQEEGWRSATVSLAYVERDGAHVRYLFHINAGVFETEQPAPLLALIARSRGLPPTDLPRSRFVDPEDSAAVRLKLQEITRSAYADSLYSLFGRPSVGIGLVGDKGRRAGRLGEYVASRDSVALDPGHMIGEQQLRHTMAHELGHRFEARGAAQLAILWTGVPPIPDPHRYGHSDLAEHQAEAIAFAVNFLQTTAPRGKSPSDALALLEHYELLVPGTRIMVRYLLLQPLYRQHPLRSVLTAA
jgi:hypothetical protein